MREPEVQLGRSVRTLRQERGWSQEHLASLMAGIGHPWHQTTVAKVEGATRPVRVNEADALAYIFDVSIDRLCLGPPKPDERLNVARQRQAFCLEQLSQAERRAAQADAEVAVCRARLIEVQAEIEAATQEMTAKAMEENRG